MNKIVCKLFILIIFGLLAWVSPAQAKPLLNNGPKIRVAVAQFGATDRFASVYGGWNIGGGLAAQLVTSLIDTKRVVVVERATLSKVLIEQELGQSQISSRFTKTPAGHLLGVDYLIIGQVTEFDERQMGGGAGLSIMKGFGPKISGQAKAAHVAIDLRIVDTRTGEILHSHRAQGRAWDKALGGKIDYTFIEFGGDIFHRTPLGKASRRAIGSAVDFVLDVIDQRNEDFSWLARVIEVDGPTIYFDAGQDSNIQQNDLFRITTVQKVLTDPETNEILGLIEHDVAYAKSKYVEKKYTVARALEPHRARVGDLVRLVRENHLIESEEPSSYRVME
jgi:curli biogenesis system outer membrane secretion channel CsgG